MQEGAVGVTAIPDTTPVGVDDEAWGGRLGEKARCKAVVTNSSGMVAATCQPYRVRPTTCLVPLS